MYKFSFKAHLMTKERWARIKENMSLSELKEIHKKYPDF